MISLNTDVYFIYFEFFVEVLVNGNFNKTTFFVGYDSSSLLKLANS